MAGASVAPRQPGTQASKKPWLLVTLVGEVRGVVVACCHWSDGMQQHSEKKLLMHPPYYCTVLPWVALLQFGSSARRLERKEQRKQRMEGAPLTSPLSLASAKELHPVCSGTNHTPLSDLLLCCTMFWRFGLIHCLYKWHFCLGCWHIHSPYMQYKERTKWWNF